MDSKGQYFKIAQLYVGVTGCPIIVRVDHANPVKFIDKIEAYKGLWIVADQDGSKVDVDVIHKEEEHVRAWPDKLQPGRVVVMEDFRVIDQKSLR